MTISVSGDNKSYISPASIVRDGPRTHAKIHQAEAWARKAHEILDKASSGRLSGDAQGVCDQAYVVTVFNLASLREVSMSSAGVKLYVDCCQMDADPKSAKQYFQRAHDVAASAGIREGTAEARMALMRLARTENATSPKQED